MGTTQTTNSGMDYTDRSTDKNYTALQLECPSCHQLMLLEMVATDPEDLCVKVCNSIGIDMYLFTGRCMCRCGKEVFSTLTVSAHE
jgi:hypothetical protein